MKFIINELKSQSYVLALKLEESYTSRRLETTVGLIKYLEDPEALKEQNTSTVDPFHFPTLKNAKKLAVETFKRLYPLKVPNQGQEEISENLLLSRARALIILQFKPFMVLIQCLKDMKRKLAKIKESRYLTLLMLT